MDFIVENALQMVPALWIVGKFVKKSELIKDKYIPFVVMGVSLVLTPLTLGGFTADNIVQALLVAGGAVLGNEIAKQSLKEE